MTKYNQGYQLIQTIGRNIRRWRELHEMKGEELAQKIGINKASLSNIENGKTDVTLHKLEKIAKVLNLSMNQLLFSDPQSIITLTQSASSNANAGLLDDLRQQLKIKDEPIKFLQSHFPSK